MATTVGDFLLQPLSEWGVQRIYGYPGDGFNGIMGAFGAHCMRSQGFGRGYICRRFIGGHQCTVRGSYWDLWER